MMQPHNGPWPMPRHGAPATNTPQQPRAQQPTPVATPNTPAKDTEAKTSSPEKPPAHGSPGKGSAGNAQESDSSKKPEAKPSTSEPKQELRTIRFHRTSDKESVCEDFLDMTQERMHSKGIDVLRELAKRSNVSGLFNFPPEWRQERKDKKKFYFFQLKGHRGWSEEDFGKIEMQSLLQYTKSKLFEIEVSMRDVQSMDSTLADEFG
uniref:Uncharacterized protein n=1 Tax=Grammatophora oceanica TaxID=210454 RepID=A0A7S1YJ53_9STRA|mmetsp:Transcript_5232/g.7289  ORF Transcript_5232/g.7289 Transcript_5232/m.7289 type:complete len:207 (+) Transcript_5232:1-621(+)